MDSTSLFFRKESYELVENVSGMGLDINLTKSKAKSRPHIATDFGQFNFLRKLISKHYGEKQIREHGGWTALHYFRKIGRYE